MAVDKTPSQVATSALQAIPFGSIIGGPLKACVEAQALAAKTTWEFLIHSGRTPGSVEYSVADYRSYSLYCNP